MPVRPEMCDGVDNNLDGIVDNVIPGQVGQTVFADAFAKLVFQAIELGLDWFRGQVVLTGDNGVLRDNTDATPLATLAFLEAPIVPAGPPRGWSGLSNSDRLLVWRMLRGGMASDPSCLNGPGEPPYTYRTGTLAMALSVYLRSGGPDELGLAVTARQCLANMAGSLAANQGQQAPNNVGGWNYNTPEGDADMSTTVFVVSGLVASSDFVEGALDVARGVIPQLERSTNADGGSGYRPDNPSTSEMTAVSIWAYRQTGVPCSDPRVQRQMRFLHDHYDYVDMSPLEGWPSNFYSRWASEKAIYSCAFDGGNGALFREDFGVRVPADDGFPFQRRTHTYDFAWQLLKWQGADGRIGTGNNGAPTSWTTESAHAFSLLTLSASLGGVITEDIVRPGDETAACSNGVDDDSDGLTDDQDRDCHFACGIYEHTVPACTNFVDDDGDGAVDFPADPGCDEPQDASELDPGCANGIDDDADGLVDFPLDPGCATVLDLDELDPAVPPACANGRDDDDDGRIDAPDDPTCLSAGQDFESFSCGDFALAGEIREDGVYRGDTRNAPDAIVTSCGTEGSPEQGWMLVIDRPSEVTLTTRHPDTLVGTTVEILQQCGGPVAGCNDNEIPPVSYSTLRLRLDPGIYLLVVETDVAAPYALDVTIRVRPPAECKNRLDDDQDGRIDFPDDPQCAESGDSTEGPQERRARCADGADNDADGKVDLDDPGCYDPADGDEADPVGGPPVCSDGRDNDGDGALDFPADPECESAGWLVEDNHCRAGVNVQDLTAAGRVLAVLAANDPDLGPVACGRAGPDHRYVYEVARPGVLVATLVNPGTEINAAVEVRDSCERPDSSLGCGPRGASGPALRADVEPGPHYLMVSGGPPAMLASLGGDIEVDDPDCNVAAAGDLGPDGIDDGCSNAFDGFGSISLGQGEGSIRVDVSAGLRVVDVPGGTITVESGFASEDVWRITFTGVVNPVEVTLNGRLGSNEEGSAFGYLGGVLPDLGISVPYLVTNDGALDSVGGTPQVLTTLVPGSPSEVDSITYEALDNNVTVHATLSGSFTFYIAIADLPSAEVAAAIAADLETGQDAVPVFGRYELRVFLATACDDGRDNDGDARVDLLDNGCASSEDDDESLPAGPLPACGDGNDNDADGRIDYPLDFGCVAQGDPSEANPAVAAACGNLIDDDADGRTDFPLDPGCAAATDADELDEGLHACADGIDNDRNGRVDFPDDPGCAFAGDLIERGSPAPALRCADGADNDLDGRIDAFDPGCSNRLDDDESNDPVEATACADGLDNDNDGRSDWPADPGCQARGDLDGESQSCRAAVAVAQIPRRGRVLGQTTVESPDRFHSLCGGRATGEAVLRYDLPVRATLRITTENPGTDFPTTVAVRRDCEAPLSELVCAGDARHPESTVVVRDAEPGEYYVFVDGAAPDRFFGSADPIALPVDPRGFVAQSDLQAGCGWSDAGNDAFDCYGTVSVTHAGQVSANFDVSVGERSSAVAGYGFHYISDLANTNVWRLRILPDVNDDPRPVTVTITGNLGSDGSSVVAMGAGTLEGTPIPYYESSDNFANPSDPPITQLLMPSNLDHINRVAYALNGDDVTITATDITLPATFYVVPSYGDRPAIVDALLSDLRAGGGLEPGFVGTGRFEVSVSEE